MPRRSRREASVWELSLRRSACWIYRSMADQVTDLITLSGLSVQTGTFSRLHYGHRGQYQCGGRHELQRAV